MLSLMCTLQIFIAFVFSLCVQGTQGKSPYRVSSSPLPSPASVGSTTSTGSGGWASTQDPSPSGSVSVPKHIVNKATEHLTISSYVNQSLDLWKTSDTLMDQCRGETGILLVLEQSQLYM